MTDGYQEFEFDLPEALLARLVEVFGGLSPAPLVPAVVAGIPEEQGVYQLFLERGESRDLVYIGKTDAAAGLKRRLDRHARKVQQRVGLDPNHVLFKAVRVFVFTAVDLETQLIEHYAEAASVSWNNSGFGSNDPGKERDTTYYKPDHFDTRFPIDIGRILDFALPMTGSAAQVLRALKANLPYLIRFQSNGGNWRIAHDDLENTRVRLDPSRPLTPESVLAQVILQLPAGWHATMLPSHVIVYKDDDRRLPSGRLIAKS